MKPTLYIMCGLPFSGKSTYSKELALKENIPRISWDESWLMLEQSGQLTGDNKNQTVTDYCEQEISKLLQSGTSVVYDNLNHDRALRDHLKELALTSGGLGKIIYIQVSYEEVHARRNRARISKERPVVDDLVFEKGLADFQPPTPDELR